MLHAITQIIVGIAYGLYLVVLAPTSQRQQAHDWLKQQNVVPMLKKQAIQPQMEAPVVNPTPQIVTEQKIIEDPWLTEIAPIIVNKKNPPAIAIVPPVPKLLLLPGARLDLDRPTSDRKTRLNKTKRTKPKAETFDTIGTVLAEKTVAQLRSLCCDRNIQWRNAHGSKHLNKAEMLTRLSA